MTRKTTKTPSVTKAWHRDTKATKKVAAARTPLARKKAIKESKKTLRALSSTLDRAGRRG